MMTNEKTEITDTNVQQGMENLKNGESPRED